MLAVLAGDPGDERARHEHSNGRRCRPGRRPGRVYGAVTLGRAAGAGPFAACSPDRRPWIPFASPSTSARCTATAPASAPPSPSWPPRSTATTASRSHPYVLSFRARPEPPVRTLPLPAAVAQRLWARRRPAARSTGGWRGTEVVHGTNYVVPPSRRPRSCRCTTAGSCANPGQASPDVRRAGEVLRRRVRRTAPSVHASSHATADGVRELLGTDRVEVVHLGPLAVPAAPADAAAGLARRLGRPAVRAGHRHRRAAQEPARRWSRRSPRPTGAATPRWSSPARPATTAPRSTRPSTRWRPPPAARCCVRARSTTSRSRGCCTTPACSPTRRSTRASASRCSRPRPRRCRSWPRDAGSIPEVAGDGAELVAARRPGRARRRARTRARPTTAAARELVAAGRTQRRPLLVVGHRRRHGRPVPAGPPGRQHGAR